MEPSVQAMAAMALAEVCRKNAAAQALAAKSGCITSLVEQLRASGRTQAESAALDAVKAQSVGAIWVLAEGHPENKRAIAAKGGIQPTVAQLAGGSPLAQRHAAFALAALGFSNDDNQRNITALLVSILSTGNGEARANATALLWRLVEQNPTTRQDMAEAGPMAELIDLLKGRGGGGPRKYALWSLSLSINESNHKVSVCKRERVGGGRGSD